MLLLAGMLGLTACSAAGPGSAAPPSASTTRTVAFGGTDIAWIEINITMDERLLTVRQIKAHLERTRDLARGEDKDGVEPRTRELALQVLRTRVQSLSTLPGSL